MTEAPFALTIPDVQTTSVLFASPHSGRSYSPSFLRRSVLDEYAIRSSEDAFVDDLVEHSHTMLVGEAPEGVLLVPARALRVEPRRDVVGPAVAHVGRPAAFQAKTRAI